MSNTKTYVKNIKVWHKSKNSTVVTSLGYFHILTYLKIDLMYFILISHDAPAPRSVYLWSGKQKIGLVSSCYRYFVSCIYCVTVRCWWLKLFVVYLEIPFYFFPQHPGEKHNEEDVETSNMTHVCNIPHTVWQPLLASLCPTPKWFCSVDP